MPHWVKSTNSWQFEVICFKIIITGQYIKYIFAANFVCHIYSTPCIISGLFCVFLNPKICANYRRVNPDKYNYEAAQGQVPKTRPPTPKRQWIARAPHHFDRISKGNQQELTQIDQKSKHPPKHLCSILGGGKVEGDRNKKNFWTKSTSPTKRPSTQKPPHLKDFWEIMVVFIPRPIVNS